jgi:hypothetical protein
VQIQVAIAFQEYALYEIVRVPQLLCKHADLLFFKYETVSLTMYSMRFRNCKECL